MIYTQAVVIRIEGNEAVVKSLATGGCGQCNSSGGCGSGKVSQLFAGKPREFRARNNVGAKAGDRVQISLPEGVLLNGALLVYLLPLLMMIAGAMVGMQLAVDERFADLSAASGSAAGLMTGFIAVRMLGRIFRISRPEIMAESNCRN